VDARSRRHGEWWWKYIRYIVADQGPGGEKSYSGAVCPNAARQGAGCGSGMPALGAKRSLPGEDAKALAFAIEWRFTARGRTCRGSAKGPALFRFLEAIRRVHGRDPRRKCVINYRLHGCSITKGVRFRSHTSSRIRASSHEGKKIVKDIRARRFFARPPPPHSRGLSRWGFH